MKFVLVMLHALWTRFTLSKVQRKQMMIDFATSWAQKRSQDTNQDFTDEESELLQNMWIAYVGLKDSEEFAKRTGKLVQDKIEWKRQFL